MTRRLVLSLATVCLATLAPLLLAEGILRFLPVHTGLREAAVNAEDPVLHFEPNREFTYSKGWSLALARTGRTNNVGYVNDQDYAPGGPRPLIAVIGDSFIEAQMVAQRDTLQGRLQRHLAGQARVYSFGASGAALSQYLAFASHAREIYEPDGYVFVIIANDFDESLMAYGMRAGFHQFRKNSDASLDLVRNDYEPSTPRILARQSALARYLVLDLEVQRVLTLFRDRGKEYVGNTAAAMSAERLADSEAVVDAFFERLPDATGVPASRVLFLVDGMRPQLYDGTTLARAEDSYWGRMRRTFITAANDHGAHVVDLQTRFIEEHQSTGERFEFSIDNHWSAKGHGVAYRATIASPWFHDLLEADERVGSHNRDQSGQRRGRGLGSRAASELVDGRPSWQSVDGAVQPRIQQRGGV